MMDADARESMQLCTVIGDTELEHQTQSVADTARPALDGAARSGQLPGQLSRKSGRKRRDYSTFGLDHWCWCTLGRVRA